MISSSNEGVYRRVLKEFSMVAFWLLAGCLGLSAQAAEAVLRMSTTTSTENSGLLAYLLPRFTQDTGIRVDVIAVGTGKALELGRRGDVDVVLVHAREEEDQFVAQGYGVQRYGVMYNDFVLAGPKEDPAHVQGGHDIVAALGKIVQTRQTVVSRGDGSGTDIMEQRYWKMLGTRPDAAHYVSAGLGMGEVLMMAAEKGGYTLTDRATLAAYQARTGLVAHVAGDSRLFNPYGIIAVNPARFPGVHHEQAQQLIAWMRSARGRQFIAEFRVAGAQVFFLSDANEVKP